MKRSAVVVALCALLAGLLTGPAGATPVATTEDERETYGRTFLEPINSVNFIQHGPENAPEEFRLGMELLEQLYPDYLAFTSVAEETDDPNAVSVGSDGVPAWHPDDTGDGLPLYAAILTDRRVPDEGKEYVLVMNAHSQEPCGREASIRFVEDLLIAATETPEQTFDDATGLTGDEHAMTAGDILARTKIYLVSTSPDGWAAGDVHGFYSASNGAGINSNRVAYQEGWVFPDSEVLYDKGYSTLTQPEGAAITEWLLDVRENELGGRPFAIASDIHGPLPVGAILFHDQGSDPVKLRRMHDLAERVRQNMTEVFASYVTGEGASAYSQAARQAEDVRDVVLDIHEDAIGKPNGALYLPLDWATYGEIWEQINYTVTGSWSGWAASNAGLDAVGLAYEVNCVYPSAGGWHPALMQLAVDNMRSILQTSVVAAAARADLAQPRFSRSLDGTVGFYEPGARITDADGNPSPPPDSYPDHPLIPQIEQTPYDVANTDYFRDLDGLVTSPVREVRPSELAGAVDGLDTLVVADDASMSNDEVEAVRRFVERGGNLVLTDAALQLVPRVADVPAEAVEEHRGYVGYADLDTSKDLATDLPRLARQTYDPIGLGYPLLMERDNYWSGEEDSGTQNSAPIWTVRRDAWEAAGGITVGTADPPDGPKDTSEGNATDKTGIGVLEQGDGRVVVFGALLPQPSEEHAHWFGLDAYTISVAGQEMLLRALTWDRDAAAQASAPSGPAEGEHVSGGSSAALPATGASSLALLAVAGLLLAGAARRRRTPGG